jgi:hypothetical protein
MWSSSHSRRSANTSRGPALVDAEGDIGYPAVGHAVVFLGHVGAPAGLGRGLMTAGP